VTDEVWISLKQNNIDTAVNECIKRLLACVSIVGQHYRQLNKKFVPSSRDSQKPIALLLYRKQLKNKTIG